MGTSAGPHNVNSDLAFGFDNGYTVANYLVHSNNARFFKGRPIENRAGYYNAVANSSYTAYSATSSGTWNDKHPRAIRAYNASGNDITGFVNTGVTDWTNTYHAHWQYDRELKKPVVVMDAFDSNWKAKSFSIDTGAWNTHGMSTGSKYVISWSQWTTNISKAVQVGVYCKNSSNTNGFHDGQSGGSTTSKNTKPRTWQRVYHVYTVSSNHDVSIDYETIYMYGHSLGPNGKGNTIKISDVQIELLTEFPSAYIPLLQNRTNNTSERTATESLLDLSRKNSISVSNVSFSTSTGLPTFDGTDDYITTGIYSGRNPSTAPFTVEAIVKPNTTGTAMMWVDVDGNGSNQRFYSSLNTSARPGNFGTQASAWSHGTAEDTNYHYQVIVMDGTTARAYDNGTQVGSRAYTSYTLPANIRVGSRSGSSYFWNGEIPVFKIYDRALTPQEVYQNFRAYKKRFEL